MRRLLASVSVVVVILVAMAACADPAGDDARARPPRSSESSGSGARGGSGGARGGGGGDLSDAAAVTEVVEATRAVDAARVELQTVYRGLDGLADVPAGVDDVRLVQRAAFDKRSRQAEAEADMSELAAVLEGAGTDDVPGDYTQPTRVVIDGDTVYTQLGPLAEQVGLLPTTWVERDVATLADQPVDNETMALLLQPLGMLDLLRLPIADVQVDGSDEVRGVLTTRLTATVDLTVEAASRAPAVAGAGADAGAGAEGAAERSPVDDVVAARFREIGLTELPVELWVGADRLVHRLEFSIGGAASGRPGPAALTTTLDVYDVGEPVDVDVPSGADVIAQADLRARVTG
jgi:hypothetical protein